MSYLRQMESTGDRLFKLLNLLNVKQLTFSKATGVSQGFLSQIMHGNAEISRGVLEKILSRYPQVNAGWLITGMGPIFIKAENIENSPPEQLQVPGTKHEYKIHPIADELFLKGILIKNLKTAAMRWDLYNQELFSVLDPTIGRQGVSKYMLGHSWPSISAILRFELVTGIPAYELLTREITKSELPDNPIHPGSQAATDLSMQLIRSSKMIQQFLASDFYQKLPK